jgi:hypothetical protein
MKPQSATSKTKAAFIPRCARIAIRLFDDACRIVDGVTDDGAGNPSSVHNIP